jgi:hypothetical protein
MVIQRKHNVSNQARLHNASNQKRAGGKKGDDKYTAKVTINTLKGTDKYVINGFIDCNYPKRGAQCFTKLSMTCETKEEAQYISKLFKDYFQSMIDRFVKGW